MLGKQRIGKTGLTPHTIGSVVSVLSSTEAHQTQNFDSEGQRVGEIMEGKWDDE